MKKKMLAGVLALLLVCVAFSGCGEEPSPYNWEVSIVDTFDPQQGCLSVLPWFTTIDEAKEILHLADLPDGAYEEKQESTRLYSITLKNVKLKEFQMPMDLLLSFQKNPGMTGQKGIFLTMYIFFLPEIDGYPLEGPDSLPIRMLPEETQQKFEQIQGADLQACMKQLLQRPDVISAQTFGFGTPSDDSFHGDASPVVPEERFSVNVMISFTKLYLSFKLY